MMLGAPGSSVMRPVVQTVRGPHAAGKRSSIATQNLASARPASLRTRHARGAGVVLLAGEIDAVLPDADDGRDDADRKPAAFERVALLDMRLEIADVPPGSAVTRARPASPTSRSASRMVRPLVRSRAASISASVTCADIGAAAEEAAEMSFLVAPRGDFDRALDATDRH